MSNLILIRRWKEGNAQIGTLYRETPTSTFMECYTCENHDKMIPEGSYRLSLYPSEKNFCDVPLLNHVPGREYIEIHIANRPDELEGCIAVGKIRGEGAVLHSKIAFEELMPKLKLEMEKLDVWIDVKSEDKG